MGYNGELLYPSKISYNGFWDIPFHKEEKVDFDLDFVLIN